MVLSDVSTGLTEKNVNALACATSEDCGDRKVCEGPTGARICQCARGYVMDTDGDCGNVRLSVSPCLCLSVCLSVCLSLSLSLCLSVCLSVCLCLSLSLSLSVVCVCVCVCVCV